MKHKQTYRSIALLWLLLSACTNQEQAFPDFDYQTVYFANQYALRTVELGEDDLVDTSMDNRHQVSIQAVMGGAYTNTRTRTIDLAVDPALCDRLYFKGTNTPVVPMPEHYYQLAAHRIQIAPGNIQGGVEVQLTDAFFADPLALSAHYVIPLVMTGAQGVDSILRGQAYDAGADRFVPSEWSILPKDYVLYGIRYVNPYHGTYLRRGIDRRTLPDATTQTLRRHAPYVENDEVVNLLTHRLTEATLPLTTQDAAGNTLSYALRLKFADNGACTLESPSPDVVLTGTGAFVPHGETNSLGGKDRHALYLDYRVHFVPQNITQTTQDTLVLRERGVYGASLFEVEKHEQ
jgi:hypothetical protein